MSDSNSWFSLVVKTGKKVNVLIVQLFLPIFCNPRRWWCNSSFQSFSLQGGGATLRWDFIFHKPFYHRPAQIGHGNLDKPDCSSHIMIKSDLLSGFDLICNTCKTKVIHSKNESPGSPDSADNL